MDIKTKKSNDIAVVLISGEVDLYSVATLKEVLRGEIEKSKNIIINLKETTYIDSSGIGALITSFSEVKKEGGVLKICEIHETVKKIFSLTKLDLFFKIYDTQESAINSFK